MWFDFKQTIELKAKVTLGVIGVVAFICLWHFAAHWNGEPTAIFPGPSGVLQAIYELFFEREFIHDIWSSIQRIVVSFSLAAAVAIPLGVLIGSFAAVSALLNPLVSAFRYLPAPAFIPLLLMWFGTGDEQKIALLFLGVIWFLVTLISDVVSNVHKDYIETSKTLGANRRTILWTVVIPASMPGIIDVCRQMLAVSWTYLVIAEIVAATDGIGAMMMRARRFVHVDDIMAGIIVIGLLGLLFDLLFRGLYWLAFPYLRHAKK